MTAHEFEWTFFSTYVRRCLRMHDGQFCGAVEGDDDDKPCPVPLP